MSIAILKGGTACLLVSATTVLNGDWIDVMTVGAYLTEHAVVGLGKVNPALDAADLTHHVYHTARDGEHVCTEAVRLLLIGIDKGNLRCLELNFKSEFRPELNEERLVGVEAAINIRGGEFTLHKEGRHTEGLGACRIISESARIGYHTRVHHLCRLGRNRQASCLRQSSNKPCAALV